MNTAVPGNGGWLRRESSRLRYVGYRKPDVVNQTAIMKRRFESLYSALPLNRISPHLPGSLESFCIRFDILHPAGGFAREALFLDRAPSGKLLSPQRRRDAEKDQKTKLANHSPVSHLTRSQACVNRSDLHTENGWQTSTIPKAPRRHPRRVGNPNLLSRKNLPSRLLPNQRQPRMRPPSRPPQWRP